MVGQIDVDSRMSKQIARGKMHVRVTSRDGHMMLGVLRPRLLRTGKIKLSFTYFTIREFTALLVQKICAHMFPFIPFLYYQMAVLSVIKLKMFDKQNISC